MQNCFPAPKSGIDLTGACNSLVPGVHTYSQESREEVYSENKRRACVMKKMLQQKEVHVQRHSLVRQWCSPDWADEDMSAQS